MSKFNAIIEMYFCIFLAGLKEDTLWNYKTFANSCAIVGFAILFKRLFTSNNSLILSK